MRPGSVPVPAPPPCCGAAGDDDAADDCGWALVPRTDWTGRAWPRLDPATEAENAESEPEDNMRRIMNRMD
jgi:hypothetical protein